MTELFLEGGWTTYPTALFGVLAVVAGVQVARVPTKRFVPLLVSLSALTMTTGFLGTIWGLAGIVKSVGNAAPEDTRMLVLACATQALNSLLIGSMLVVVALIAASSGALRLALGARLDAQPTR